MSMNSTIFLRLLVSRRLNWKLYLRLSPQMGSLPYFGTSPNSPFTHGRMVTGSNTLKITLDTPHTLYTSVLPLMDTDTSKAWLAAVGNTPFLANTLLMRLPNFQLLLAESI